MRRKIATLVLTLLFALSLCAPAAPAAASTPAPVSVLASTLISASASTSAPAQSPVLVQAQALAPTAAASSASLDLPASTDDASTMNHVFDMADMLSYEQWEDLEARAAAISKAHNCGVYFAFVEDWTQSGCDDVYEATYQAYHDNQLGMGEGRDGIIVMLSMEGRDYAMFVYGSYAEYAVNGFGCEQLEGEFLSSFSDNDWYGGVSRYLDACDEYLTLADEGTPVRANPWWGIVLAVVGSCVIAFAICMKLRKRMVNVAEKGEANAYVTADGLRLTEQNDNFTHTTETRTKIESSSSGSTSSCSGGGGHGRSGSF